MAVGGCCDPSRSKKIQGGLAAMATYANLLCNRTAILNLSQPRRYRRR